MHSACHCNYSFFFQSCLGQETAKEPFGLRVKLPLAYSTCLPQMTKTSHCLTIIKYLKNLHSSILGSTTTDRDILTANLLTANKLIANNADWLRRAILNIFLLSPEPSCPNPHFVTKSLPQNQ